MKLSLHWRGYLYGVMASPLVYLANNHCDNQLSTAVAKKTSVVRNQRHSLLFMIIQASIMRTERPWPNPHVQHLNLIEIFFLHVKSRRIAASSARQ